jgi:SAM-dependent methyltransferase
MFFADHVTAFRNIARALVPGGRLVLVTWQGPDRNEWVQEITGALTAGRDRPTPPRDAPGPFSLSDPERVGSVLAAAGFHDVALDGLEAPMWFGTDADDGHRFAVGLLGWMLEGLDEARRTRALDDLRATLAAHATSDGVRFDSAAWVISATRR